MTTLIPNFLSLTQDEQFVTLMCPTTPQAAKVVNKFIKILFEARQKILDGQQENEVYLNL